MASLSVEIEEAHRAACAAGKKSYTDPETGYNVFTENFHKERGWCCGNGCRHCIFGHYNVKPEYRSAAPAVTQPVLLDPKRRQGLEKSESGIVVLFWSGGKDSYLALRELQTQVTEGTDILLLTTFDAASAMVAFQEIPVQTIMDQAKALKLPLLVVPLQGTGAVSNDDYKTAVLGAVDRFASRITSLAFGDLHLADIRDWRKATFGPHFECRFPIFGVPYEDLLQRLVDDSAASITVSAVRDDMKAKGIEVGAKFDADFVKTLPKDVDAMGESGEFHTCVRINPQ